MYHTRLTRLTPNELQNYLIKMKYTPARCAEVKEWVEVRKKTIRQHKIERQETKNKWREFIAPLSKEIKQIQTVIPHHLKLSERNPVNAEMASFYTSYLALLIKTRGLLDKHKSSASKTPKQVNPEATQWEDYIPHKIKLAFERAYHSIPNTTKHSIKRNLWGNKQ